MLGLRQAFKWLAEEIREDRRMQISIAIGLVMGPMTIWLFRHLVAMGYNKFHVNIAISLSTGVLWYFINRLLFADRHASRTRTATGSLAWWLFSFGAHQALFVGAVGLVGLPYFMVKSVQLGLQPPEFFMKYWFNKNKLFVRKTEA
jgi:hypothetical protein